MGKVYEAEDLESQTRVAIKTIRPDVLEQPHVEKRFKREVAPAKEVAHPNVCRVFDLFRHKNAPCDGPVVLFVSMELLRGKTLSSLLKRTVKISSSEALPLVIQMAHALSAAHDAGIVHRDFKPGNIVLVPSTGAPNVRAVVTGFGMPMRPNEDFSVSLTPGGHVVGTPAYMSPEQVQGHDLTPASDIYSLGLVIYEMVTGHRPFDADSPLTMALKRLKETPLPPRSLVPDLNRRWEDVISTCLQTNPNNRFSRASEIAEALVNPRVRLKRWSHINNGAGSLFRVFRNRILATAVLAGLGALLTFVATRQSSSPRIVESKQLTFNKLYNDSPLFTDGRRIYFQEAARKPPPIAAIPVTGGEAVHIPTVLQDAVLLGLISRCHSERRLHRGSDCKRT